MGKAKPQPKPYTVCLHLDEKRGGGAVCNSTGDKKDNFYVADKDLYLYRMYPADDHEALMQELFICRNTPPRKGD